MANFESGVSGYVYGTTIVKVPFPIDLKGNLDRCCDQCPYFRRSYKTCGLNNSVCYYPNKYIGAGCPLQFEEDTHYESDSRL